MRPTRTWETEVAKLEAREREATLGGGAARLEELRAKGKLTARERIDYLVDPGSFVELKKLAEHQCRDFGMEGKKFLGDGVVVGYGTIAGRKVYLYSEDASVLGGSTGKVHGAKIHYVLTLAREHRVPIICLNDSAGARIQEGMDNVYGVTGMFRENTNNSGVVPQIAAIMGACTGGAAYSAALCDFVVQVKGAYAFVTGPAVIQSVTGEKVSFEDLGGADVHATKSGFAHFAAKDDRECLDLIRTLLAYLPQSNAEKPAREGTGDSPFREVPELLDLVPIDPRKTYDMRKVVRAIADNQAFFEIHPGFARNVTVGFLRLDGHVTGVVANNPFTLGGCLDVDSSDKAARFIRTCDVFNIPIVTLVDVPGFLPGVRQEHSGLLRHGAKMLHAWTEATVPKVACVLRKMYGGAIPAMGVHEIGFDQVFAWPSAEMQMVGAEPAVKVLYRRELEKASDPQAFLQEKMSEYQDLYLTPYHSASLSVIDAVIHPKDTRKRLISALRMLEGKIPGGSIPRKHTNIPL